ncbi:uncharacterized protein LOC108630012, partial [Ceratina calcarata]|uniref:Uncharacterized protein LOC108630012 n=1 Tax=Ceratina calcarata TaxID=156304 RepID=A0AAJ7ND54_9HYME
MRNLESELYICFQMMENAYSQLNDLKRSEEKHCTNVREKCDRLHELCNEFNDQTADSYNANTEMRNELREQVREGIERIENDVIVSTKQSEEIVGQIKEQGFSLINELRSSVNEGSEVLQEYKNKVNLNAIEIQTQMNKDRLKILSLME